MPASRHAAFFAGDAKQTLRGAMLILILAALALAGAARAEEPGAWADIHRDFTDPPLRCKPRPLWFWNGPLSAEKTRSILEGCRASGYGGVGILPTPDMSPAFMSPAYLDRYEEAVDRAAELGMKCCLYDEFWFPSGSAGGELARKYPEALGKRLDMTVIDVAGPTRLTPDVHGPSGNLRCMTIYRELPP